MKKLIVTFLLMMVLASSFGEGGNIVIEIDQVVNSDCRDSQCDVNSDSQSDNNNDSQSEGNSNSFHGCIDGNLTVPEGETLREETLKATCINGTLTLKCVEGNQTYLEGDTVNGDCGDLTCTQGKWALPFIPVQGSGSIMVVEKMKNFDDAKSCCQEIGSQLVIPDNYESLRQYMMDNYEGSLYLLGIFNQTWMDGESIDSDLLRISFSASRSCGALNSGTSVGGMIMAMPCSFGLNFICQMV